MTSATFAALPPNPGGASPSIGVWVDFENMYWGLRQFSGDDYRCDPIQLADALRQMVRDRYQTEPRMVRFYADFENSTFQGTMSALQRHMVQTVHVFARAHDGGVRKNASDIKMSLDMAASSFRNPFDVYVIVSGDRDLCHIAEMLREHGRSVHVVAFTPFAAAELLQAFACEVTALETLPGLDLSAVSLRALESASVPMATDPFELLKRQLAENGELPLPDDQAIIRAIWHLEQVANYVGYKRFQETYLDGRFDRRLDLLAANRQIETYRTPTGRNRDDGSPYSAAAVRVVLEDPYNQQILGLSPQEAERLIAARAAGNNVA